MILNTFKANEKGTLISSDNGNRNVKAIATQENIAVINLEGKGLLGQIGIDARIFKALHQEKINISVISQGSSERSVGFIIDAPNKQKAIDSLLEEFSLEYNQNDINTISAIEDVALITVIGQNLAAFSSSHQALIKNNVNILLLNNTIKGNNVTK